MPQTPEFGYCLNEAGARLREADALFDQVHPDGDPAHGPVEHVGGCDQRCHRIAHLRQTATVYASLAVALRSGGS